MTILLIGLLGTSHLLATIPFWRKIKDGMMPGTVDFATVSIILYYDVGILCKSVFPNIRTDYFTPLTEADDRILTLAVLILTAAPWLFHAGAALAKGGQAHDTTTARTSMKASSAIAFYAICLCVCGPLTYLGLQHARSSDELWVIRARVTAEWGPLIVVLYLPLHLLAFYVAQANSRTWFGLLMAAGLPLATVVSTAPIGQRTTVLLPFLVIVFFRLKLSVTRIAMTAVLGILGAALLLSSFKWQYTGSTSMGELLAQTVADDFSRDGVLARTLGATELIGTRVLAYPMSGYAYCALFFVPRSLAPLKGYPTAQCFTAYVVGLAAETTDWGFGVGAIEEILLNGGLLLFVPLMLVYGLVMGILDRLSGQVPSLLVPTRLGAVWLCGYNLSALLLLFGTMSLVVVALHSVLVGRGSSSSRVGIAHHPSRGLVGGVHPTKTISGRLSETRL
jgi:hypothetical protein